MKKTGKHILSGCVKNPKTRKEHSRNAAGHRICPRGETRRSSYLRRLSSGVLKRGYTVRRKNGKTYRVQPKKRDYVRVHSTCVAPIRQHSSQARTSRTARTARTARIPIFHRGALKKFGYYYKLPVSQRHSALKKAIHAYGAMNVYHKLNAVAKLAVRSAPRASHAFRSDSTWVLQTYKKK